MVMAMEFALLAVCDRVDQSSGGVDVDSLNSGDSVCKDSEGWVSEDSVEEDFEDLDVEDPDEGDGLVFLLIASVTTNNALNETQCLSSSDSRVTNDYLLKDGLHN